MVNVSNKRKRVIGKVVINGQRDSNKTKTTNSTKSVVVTRKRKGRVTYRPKSRLTPADRAYVELKARNPSMPKRVAYMRTHKTTNIIAAGVASTRLDRKPEVKVFTQQIEDKARSVLKDLLIDSNERKEKPAFARLARDVANDILDRNLGKATTRTETQSTNVNLNIEASTELADNFEQFLADKTKQQ